MKWLDSFDYVWRAKVRAEAEKLENKTHKAIVDQYHKLKEEIEEDQRNDEQKEDDDNVQLFI